MSNVLVLRRPGARHKINPLKLNNVLSHNPALHFPDFSLDFVVHNDASEHGVGAFLAQPSRGNTDDKGLDVVAHYSNDKWPFPSFKSGNQMLIHRPYSEIDGPNLKLNCPWHRSHTVRARLSPVKYRISKYN